MRMETLSKTLSASADADAWWLALTREMETMSLISLRWIGPRGQRERVFARRPATWRLEVAVSSTDSIEIAGLLEASSRRLDLVALAETMERTFPVAERAQIATAGEPAA
jgi:hypothetical protein